MWLNEVLKTHHKRNLFVYDIAQVVDNLYFIQTITIAAHTILYSSMMNRGRFKNELCRYLVSWDWLQTPQEG